MSNIILNIGEIAKIYFYNIIKCYLTQLYFPAVVLQTQIDIHGS